MIFFMALTEELQIYRATYRLLNLLIRATQDFLYKANSSHEKVELIKEFLSRFNMLQMLLRVCAEQKVIDVGKVAVLSAEYGEQQQQQQRIVSDQQYLTDRC